MRRSFDWTAFASASDSKSAQYVGSHCSTLKRFVMSVRSESHFPVRRAAAIVVRKVVFLAGDLAVVFLNVGHGAGKGTKRKESEERE